MLLVDLCIPRHSVALRGQQPKLRPEFVKGLLKVTKKWWCGLQEPSLHGHVLQVLSRADV